MTNRLTEYRGREYHDELRRILNGDEGKAIIKEAETVKEKANKLTPFDICVITVNHNLPFRAVVEYLEDKEVAPTGLYGRLMASGFKVQEALQIASERIKEKVNA